MNKKELKKWNENILDIIAYLTNQYEIMNGIGIDGKALPKSKVKFNGLYKHCKFKNKNDVIGI